MNMEHWWIDTDRGQQMYCQRHLFQCNFPHMDWFGIEPGDPRSQVSTCLPELWYGTTTVLKPKLITNSPSHHRD